MHSTSRAWWKQSTWWDIQKAFCQKIGRPELLREKWLERVLMATASWWATGSAGTKEEKTAKRRDTLRVAQLLIDNEELRAAFDTVYRLKGRLGARVYLRMLIKGSPEEQRARRQEERTTKRTKQLAHARAMLAKHVRALAREERAVARWGQAVRRLEHHLPPPPVDAPQNGPHAGTGQGSSPLANALPGGAQEAQEGPPPLGVREG